MGDSTTSAVPGNKNCTPAIIDVAVKTPVEPGEMSRVANQFRKRPFPSQPPTAVRQRRTTVKIMQAAMERRKVEDVQSKIGNDHPGNHTASSNEMDEFEDHSASDLLPGYSIGPNFVKDVPQDWIMNCRLPLGLIKEPLAQIYKTKLPFVPASCIDHYHRVAVFSNDQHVCYVQELASLRASLPEMEAMIAQAHR